MPIPAAGITPAVKRAPVRYGDPADILPPQIADANPPVIGPLPVQLTSDGFTPDKAGHECPRFPADPGRGLRAVDPVQADRGPGHDYRVHVAHHGDAALDGTVCEGRSSRKENQNDDFPDHQVINGVTSIFVTPSPCRGLMPEGAESYAKA